jgi:hypothetical protein
VRATAPRSIDERATRRWLVESATVAAGALLLVAALLWIEGPEPHLRGDQYWGSLMALKHLHPDWFQGDMFYGRETFRGYNPFFFEVQAAIAERLGGDLVAALRVLAWPVGWLFAVGHYALFRYVGAAPVPAGLGVLGALTVRNALAGEHWGFLGARDVLPRVAFLGLAPLLTVAFLHYRERRWLPAYYLMLGVCANVHPVSGLHLAQATGAAHLVLARGRRRAWIDVGLGAVAFALGALPFAVAYFSRQEALTDPALAPVARAALDYRFPYLFYPLSRESLLSVAFHAMLPAILLTWVLVGHRSERLRALTTTAGAAVVLGLLGTAVFQAIGTALDRPYPDIHQLRATKLAYLALLAGLPLALHALRARGAGWFLAAAVLVTLALVPPGAVIHAFSGETRAAVKRALGAAVPAIVEPVAPPAAQVRARATMLAWVSSHAGRNDLFLTDDFSFRFETRRPITGSFKDGGIVTAGPGPLVRWYHYMQEIEACRARAGESCWLALGRRLGARFAVVDPDLSRVAPEPWAERVWAEHGWSVWRLEPGRR